MNLVAELETLIDAFEREGVEYALCGGLALALYGHPRATMDIDVLVPAEGLARAVAVAASVGFDVPAKRTTFGLRTGAPREVQRVSKLDPGTNDMVSLDFLIVGPVLEPVWTTRTALVVGSRRIRVVSREGLATMKRLAGRKQDLADLAALEGSCDDET